MKTRVMMAFMLAGLAGCGGHASEYPKEVKDNYMQACLANGGNEPICGCQLKKVQKKYSYAEFVTADTNARSGDLSHPLFQDLMGKFTQECVAGK